MLSHPLVSIAVAAILGTLAGLGVGGGSLLILWLTMVLGMDPQTARTINLMFFLPSALIATILRWKENALELKAILPAILSGCLAAFITTIISRGIDTAHLKKLFGILLIAVGIKEVLYRPRNAK